ncbi:aconitate hydratase [Turicibacter sp. H121]|uniref:aconitate hydratase n=1 Tax=Turicibacter sp. H121 TaxID=1712675 RepID=UPI000762ECA9|nr:aconitate hydratase [Turicibacter sp. H121]AMC09562.1 aconitate hydratase [Turicibacter sp. H121]MCU7199155.1 aconitate hydratase [Turicibacter sp. H121]
MGLTLSQKIIQKHLLHGEMKAGEEIAISIDQTLTQDSTGTMAYLQLEAMNIDQVKTKRSVAYIDHNMLQVGFENADDHKYIQTVANKYGIYFSKPGNGICHQVHLERFGVPGQTLIGSDSHTPTCGGLGMLAIGAGGLDVALAMAGQPYYLKMPKMVQIKLTGALRTGVSSKDIILEVLRLLSVKGGVGKIIEYSGEGVKTLTVPERATMTNMGAELGATTSIFPSDEQTYAFLKAQQREQDFTALVADEDADYDECYEIDLDELEPLVAKPHSPDAISTVEEVGAIKVDQVAIGSCTNGSYLDLMKVAAILKGKRVHPDVSLVISPGSKQVLTMLAQNGALADLIASGARILESGCGPCIGMGQAPASHAVSLRTFNRNFYGRCGTLSAQVYLCSPETAAYSAISGTLVSPLQATTFEHPSFPHQFEVLDNSIILPNELKQDVVRGPNIKSFPLNEALKKDLEASVLLKVEDNITTDHIMPSNAKLLPYRSNIPYLSNHCFETIDSTFSSRAKQAKQGFIVGGENYGQGSSREHAALVPLYLGIKAVFAKSFARIHRSNLINSGILPFEFEQSSDYDLIEEGDRLSIKNLKEAIELNQTQLTVTNQSKQSTFTVHLPLSPREKEAILAGGIINLIRQREEA